MKWFDGEAIHSSCAVFYRVNEKYGELSNMSNAFPLEIDGIKIKSTEALYQACRYPHQPDWQQEILDAPHAMRAKMAAKKDQRRKFSRPDWEEVRVVIMKWCLELKLEQHFGPFYQVLKSTSDRMIVEKSKKDRFWGAVENKEGILEGQNKLGMLLMQLRNEAVTWMQGNDDDEIWPEAKVPDIPNFNLLSVPLV